MRSYLKPRCPILYVDDSSDDHCLLQAAATRTQTPLLIQPFFSVDPAIAYLKGEPPFGDVTVYPRPRLVLCDYNLGATNGSALVAAIRAASPCSDLPIIMFSGFGGDDTVANSYEAGADYFLCKPISSSRLDALVRTLYACATSQPSNFRALLRLPEHKAHPLTTFSTFLARPPGHSWPPNTSNTPQHHPLRSRSHPHPPSKHLQDDPDLVTESHFKTHRKASQIASQRR
jgi:DNA-binding response OmpR family regulator